MVFPEGVRGMNKTFDQRYQLQRFGTGFMRLALETGAPIVPVGIVGSEEQQPGLANLRGLGRALGMPAFPITPTFPWLGPLGLLPLPVRYRIHFGEPHALRGRRLRRGRGDRGEGRAGEGRDRERCSSTAAPSGRRSSVERAAAAASRLSLALGLCAGCAGRSAGHALRRAGRCAPASPSCPRRRCPPRACSSSRSPG